MFLVDLNCFVMSKQVIKRFVQKNTQNKQKTVKKKITTKRNLFRMTFLQTI